MRPEKSYNLMENLLAGRNGGAGGEERDRLLRALKKACRGELTPRQAECVKLFYGGRVSQREIAARLGVSPPTVSRHLKKARARLGRVLRYYL